MNSESNNKFLSKIVCKDTDKNCAFKEPYSELQFLTDNPATGRPYTEQEITEKKEQYKNMCSLSTTKIQRCCDTNNPLYDTVNSELENSDNKLMVKKLYQAGEHKGYDTCANLDGDCDDSFQPATAHDVCKILSNKNTDEFGSINGPNDFYKLTDKRITNLVADCPPKCDNSEYVPFLKDPLAMKSDKVLERKIIEAVKNDEVETLIVYFNDKRNESVNNILTEGYPGNTLLHESISFRAENCNNFILNNNTVDLEIKNKDGNTPIHLSALQGNSSLTYRLLQLGSSTDTKNFYGDTVLHSAVRSNDLSTVSIVLSQGASVMEKNNLGETPLHTAVMSSGRDLKIIRLLVNIGSDLLTTNNNNSTIVHTLDLFANTKKNAEIRTFLVNSVYESNKENYPNLLRTNPEFSFINVVDEDTGEPLDLKEFENLNKLEIEYPDVNISNTLLYDEKESLPRKTNIKETFTNKKQNNTKTIKREKVDCYSFIYKVSAVFALLIAVLVVLKLMKKI